MQLMISHLLVFVTAIVIYAISYYFCRKAFFNLLKGYAGSRIKVDLEHPSWILYGFMCLSSVVIDGWTVHAFFCFLMVVNAVFYIMSIRKYFRIYSIEDHEGKFPRIYVMPDAGVFSFRGHGWHSISTYAYTGKYSGEDLIYLKKFFDENYSSNKNRS